MLDKLYAEGCERAMWFQPRCPDCNSAVLLIHAEMHLIKWYCGSSYNTETQEHSISDECKQTVLAKQAIIEAGQEQHRMQQEQIDAAWTCDHPNAQPHGHAVTFDKATNKFVCKCLLPEQPALILA